MKSEKIKILVRRTKENIKAVEEALEKPFALVKCLKTYR
jgi:hypothetical protein